MSTTRSLAFLAACTVLWIIMTAGAFAQVNLAGDWIESGGRRCIITQQGVTIYVSNPSLASNSGARGYFRDASTIRTENGWGGGSATISNNGNQLNWANGIVWVRTGRNSTTSIPEQQGQTGPWGHYHNNPGAANTHYTSGSHNPNNTTGTSYGAVNLTGNWTQDAGGALCRVNQETNVIDFTNMSSPNIKGRGSFNGPYSIMMDGDFGGGTATVTSDGNEIHWANGIRWIRRR